MDPPPLSPLALEQKTNLLVWLNSDCKTPSRREKLWAALIPHLPPKRVHEYGHCGVHKYPKSDNAAAKQMVRESKFYASFENSLCSGYITEKFWKALMLGTVPLAYGGQDRRDYEILAPPKSFIHVDDFATPEALAKYLLYLDHNETAYREYFDWRNTYAFVHQSVKRAIASCNMCRLVLTRNTSCATTHGEDSIVRQDLRYDCDITRSFAGCDLPNAFRCRPSRAVYSWIFNEQCRSPNDWGILRRLQMNQRRYDQPVII